MNLVVRSRDELVAAVPHVLGFVPEHSIVVLPLSGVLPIARLDLPKPGVDPGGVVAALSVPYRRNVTSGASVAIVCFSEAQDCADETSRRLAERFEAFGIATRARLTATEDRWVDLDTRDSGARSEQAALHVASIAVYAGKTQPASSREALTRSLHGDHTVIAVELEMAKVRAAFSQSRVEREFAVERCHQFDRDGLRLDGPDAARLLVAMRSPETRDAIWAGMSRDNAASQVALMRDLVRRAPDDVRTAPAALLAFSCWLNGQGALGWCALDQIPPGRPDAMEAVVATLLQEGLNPQEWPEVSKFLRTLAADLDLATESSPAPPVSRQRPEPPGHGERRPEPPGPER